MDEYTEALEWYGAAVQIEHRSDRQWSIDWAYVELKARSPEAALAKLHRLFREGIKINYCQLV